MNKGWECPKCGKVFAPHIEECKYCNEREPVPAETELIDSLKKAINERNEPKPGFDPYPFYPPGWGSPDWPHWDSEKYKITCNCNCKESE